MRQVPNVYSIDRKAAAERLGISMRTLDRYLKSGLIHQQTVGRRILLNEKEIDKLLKLSQTPRMMAKIAPQITQPIKSTSLKKVPFEMEVRGEETETTSKAQNKAESNEKIFQKLYEELLKEMKAQQKRLEGANYRVGQLEAELKNSVPLLEYRSETSKLKEREREVHLALEREKIECKKTEYQLKLEKMNKLAYAIVLFLLVALQPFFWIWLSK